MLHKFEEVGGTYCFLVVRSYVCSLSFSCEQLFELGTKWVWLLKKNRINFVKVMCLFYCHLLGTSVWLGALLFYKRAFLFMPPTSKKLGGHIALGLFVRPIHPFVRHAFETSYIEQRMLGFWNFIYVLLLKKKGKADPYFFLLSDSS